MKKLKDSYLIFLIPALILVILVQFLPMLYGLYLSVQNIVLNKPFVPVQFTWLSNYIELLSDSTFYYSIGVTFFIGIICVILQLIIGLLLALLLDTEVEKNKPVPGMGFFRGILFMPYMLMPIIVGIVWLVMYDQTYGLFNYFLTFFGVKPISWFANQNTAVWAIIIMDTWQCVPMIMLILSSGLKAIDYSFYEAAEIDGASIWQKFKYLTLPFLKPVILVAVAIRTMDVLMIQYMLLLVVAPEELPR
jgi:multiple sugar transport system permease protein